MFVFKYLFGFYILSGAKLVLPENLYKFLDMIYIIVFKSIDMLFTNPQNNA